MEDDVPPTITALKLHFLHTEILALSQPLTPSDAFLETNATSDRPLRSRQIEDALVKLNNNIRQHNKLAYGPQATRHVAEQIDALYWGAGQTDHADKYDDAPELGTDLCLEDSINKLPETWDSREASRRPDHAEEYEILHNHLSELNKARKAARLKLERYKALRAMVEPFSNTEAIQSNLVIKNGELETELERMKLLMARVGGRLDALPVTDEAGNEMLIDVNEDEGVERLKSVLDMT